MPKKPRLVELTWLGKENRRLSATRRLIEHTDLGHVSDAKYRDDNKADNRLIQGENLLALGALRAELTGKVRCVYIDPPYNTRRRFEHYDDRMGHHEWLSFMRDRLVILRDFLSENGSIWISIDDREGHYLKVLCDEVFGRKNFYAHFIWRKILGPSGQSRSVMPNHEHILCYARRMDTARFNMRVLDKLHGTYIIPDGMGKRADQKPRGSITRALLQGGLRAPPNPAVRKSCYLEVVHNPTPDHAPYYDTPMLMHGNKSWRSKRPSAWYSLTAPDGTDVWPLSNDGTERSWRFTRESMEAFIKRNKTVWKKHEVNGWKFYERYYAPDHRTAPYTTIWTDVSETKHACLHLKQVLGNDNALETPKPEQLIRRVLEIATDPGDTVLDCFAGSGTTGAAAHKMGRTWVMIEAGEQALSHAHKRLRQVLNGCDPGGVTKATGWTGGGRFKFYTVEGAKTVPGVSMREEPAKRPQARQMSLF